MAPPPAPRGERETPLVAPWSDGRIPRIASDPDAPLAAYHPGGDVRAPSGAGAASGAPRHVETTVCAGAPRRTATGRHFGRGGITRSVLRSALDGPSFGPVRRWWGPVWFNVNGFPDRGQRQHGQTRETEALRHSVLRAASTSEFPEFPEFAEFPDPITEEARGSREFSRTTAPTLDPPHTPPVPPGGAPTGGAR
ncbi:hypothetical protein E0L36_03100 [Streptomyces sp. AJS327]|uniref:MGH1-like glycoside hydrolase domain-containing protein n=1 Tax=Streptomyces sp. AJS327 TaxID=2545265 RepID=UPI0015DD9153|nr:hypothetical protein [Streptomyces sp. AJS327]MBA0049919.1 hypothetical protein [Streptomyces sp. AJS327]